MNNFKPVLLHTEAVMCKIAPHRKMYGSMVGMAVCTNYLHGVIKLL